MNDELLEPECVICKSNKNKTKCTVCGEKVDFAWWVPSDDDIIETRICLKCLTEACDRLKEVCLQEY